MAKKAVGSGVIMNGNTVDNNTELMKRITDSVL